MSEQEILNKLDMIIRELRAMHAPSEKSSQERQLYPGGTTNRCPHQWQRSDSSKPRRYCVWCGERQWTNPRAMGG